MKLHQNIQLSTAIKWLVIFSPLTSFAFPIFNPPLAYINCQTSPSFIGDNSNTTLGFAGGTHSNTTWSTDRVVLSASQTTGTFTSRVIDNACTAAGKPWVNFQWTTSLPFGKEIPPTNETTTSYSGKTNSTLNTSLMFLWRFNEATAYNTTPGEIIDSSGNGRHGTIKNWPPLGNTKVAGKFNNALSCTVEAVTPYLPAASLPTSNYVTFSIWFKSSVTSAWTQFATRDTWSGDNFWRFQQDASCIPNLAINVGGVGSWISTSTSVCDGNWHHLVLVLNNGNAAIWIDGNKTTGTYTQGTGFAAAELLIGNGMLGVFDELAYWNRALADAEVIELYRRGINRVKIQVRNCTSNTCADNPAWQGPDGTASTWFTELNNNSNQLTGLGTVQAGAPTLLMSNFPAVTKNRRYIQYKFTLETDNVTYSPDVKTIGPGK